MLPWKYMDEMRMHDVDLFIRALGAKLGPRSTAVLVDHILSISLGSTDSSHGEKAAPEWTASLQISSHLLATIDHSSKKGLQAIGMLEQSTLPVVIDALTSSHRFTTGARQSAKDIACVDASLLRCLSTFINISPQLSTIQSTFLFPVLARQSMHFSTP